MIFYVSNGALYIPMYTWAKGLRELYKIPN